MDKKTNNWQTKKLGEVCSIQTGKYDANHANSNGKNRFYTCAFDYLYCDTNRFKGQSIILPGNGANVGEVFYYNGDFDAYQRTYVLNEIKTDAKYLFYHLLGNWKNRNKDKQFGSATNYIRMANFTDYEIPIPPLETQQAIVSKIEELFSELDKGIAELKTAQQQLKTYRQSVLKSAFEGKLTNENVKDGELPDGWKVDNFGNVVINFDGKRKPLSRIVRATRQGKYRYYGATEIVDYIDDFIFEGRYLLIGEDGANLLSKSRPLAFIVEGKFWVNNHAHIIQTKDSLNLDFLSYYFNSLNIGEYVTGTAQPKLNQANMNKIPIPLPPIEEQHQIVQEIESRLSVADKMEQSIQESLQNAEALRQSILKKAFCGELV